MVDWPTRVTMQGSFKDHFEDGWSKYVKLPFAIPPVSPPENVYWNPRAGGWYTYTTRENEIQDRSWCPRTDTSGYAVSAQTTYDHITEQYLSLPQADQPNAFWD